MESGSDKMGDKSLGLVVGGGVGARVGSGADMERVRAGTATGAAGLAGLEEITRTDSSTVTSSVRSWGVNSQSHTSVSANVRPRQDRR
jgi:hypothetical protein